MTARSAAFQSNAKGTLLLGVWSVFGGSNLNVLGNYFKHFWFNAVFLACFVVVFEVLQNTMGSWTSFSIISHCLKKKKSIEYSPFYSVCLPTTKRGEQMFQISFISYFSGSLFLLYFLCLTGYWNSTTHVYWMWAVNFVFGNDHFEMT